MLARVRSCFLLSFLVAFSVAACLPVQAQINGVPASVTSYGFGGRTNPNPGIRAGVTSLGPTGYGNSHPVFGTCCNNFFLPVNSNFSLFSGRRHQPQDRSFFPVGISQPVYIPYAVPYALETDDSADDYVRAPRQPNPDTATKRTAGQDSAPKAAASDKPTPVEPQEPVAAQPSTVLVFKDGHYADVLNYAIVGDALFDFALGRTHKILLADLDLPATRKANDDHGVDFQIPAGTTRQ